MRPERVYLVFLDTVPGDHFLFKSRVAAWAVGEYLWWRALFKGSFTHRVAMATFVKAR